MRSSDASGKRLEQIARIVVMDADIAESLRLDERQELGDAVDERLGADERRYRDEALPDAPDARRRRSRSQARPGA